MMALVNAVMSLLDARGESQSSMKAEADYIASKQRIYDAVL